MRFTEGMAVGMALNALMGAGLAQTGWIELSVDHLWTTGLILSIWAIFCIWVTEGHDKA